MAIEGRSQRENGKTILSTELLSQKWVQKDVGSNRLFIVNTACK